MRLARPFYRLPICFDAERMRSEVAALPASAWANHPNEIKGNSSIRLISVDGGENDLVNGTMMPTAHLLQSPYLRQVLASFGVVWSRSRLLRLAPGATVPEHADINYHWFSRVRVHFPILTLPGVRFRCEPESIHMVAGEVWIFDNWRLHSVENPTERERIHLVADTSGSAAFWQLVAQSGSPGETVRRHVYDPAWRGEPLTERTMLAPVMSPAEVELLTLDLRGELIAISDTPESRAQLLDYHALLDGFCRDWRQLYALYGEIPAAREHFIRLRDGLRSTSRARAEGLIMRTNRVDVHRVLEGRLLRTVVADAEGAATANSSSAPRGTSQVQAPRARLARPIFIIAAPRSGSTLLFEALATSGSLHTLGGEAHWLVESLPELQPGAPGVESNRLTAEHCTDAVAARIVEQILGSLHDSCGRRVTATESIRLLEKTPKNALRVPFFDRIFPDALFVFLWRDPRENISSIMDAWRSGKWKTYNGLDGFIGPWSLLLPPGWQSYSGKPLEEIAAYQWNAANQIVLGDLAALPRARWTTVRYADLIGAPKASVSALCEFLQIEMDAPLNARLSAPLPHSLFTLTPPEADKWRRNEAAISRVLPSVAPTWRALQELD
jgi:LPS sulfotransferase NodH